ncbi:Egg protein, partial [Schistosoma japonicum]
HVTMIIYRDRTIQFVIIWVDDFIWKLATMLTQEYFLNPSNCPITLKITEGIYNGSEDGNGTITDEELIYRKSIPAPNSIDSTLLTIIPSFRCRAQTTENKCTTESIRNVTCTWCTETNRCVL